MSLGWRPEFILRRRSSGEIPWESICIGIMFNLNSLKMLIAMK